MRRLSRLAALAAVGLCARPAAGQQPAAPPPPATAGFDFSGWMFGSYSYRTDSASKAGLGGKSPNGFNYDRLYLTFRMPAGDNGAIRVSTDLYQNQNAAQNAFYQGWAVRLKFAYFQYTGLRDQFGTGSSLVGRAGLVHNVSIDHEELFWPRYLNTAGIERTGFFSSSDMGVAGQLTLGNKMGELYGTITNGGGYTTYEKDRFKDFALRATFTPMASHASANAIARSFAISPWVYLGKVGSGFAAGGAGQVGPGDNGAITDGLTRNRYGIFAGVRDRRLNAGVDLAVRKDESETGANTAVIPRAVTDSTGRLIDGFIVARPLEWIDASKRSAISVVARFDRFTPNTSPTSANYAGTTPAYSFVLLGASYDLTQRITLTLDYQAQSPTGFPPPTGTNVKPTPKQSTAFLHWQVLF